MDTESKAYPLNLKITYLDRYKNVFELGDTVEVYVHALPPASPLGYVLGLGFIAVIGFFVYRYYAGQKKMAKLHNKTVQSIYRNIARIHMILVRCVRRTLSQEGIL